MTPRQKLGKARVRTFDFVPYLASYIYTLREQETPGLATAAVDEHGNLYWDPHWVGLCDVDALAYTVAHEAIHLVYEHCKRAKDLVGTSPPLTQQYIINVAADLVVEQTLSMMRRHRPTGAVHLGCVLPRLGGMVLDFPENQSMPEYYRLILEKLRSAPQPDSQGSKKENSSGTRGGRGDKNRSGAGSTPAAFGGEPAHNHADEASRDGVGGVPPPHQTCAPMSGGSAADGQARPYEIPDDGDWDTCAENMAARGAEKAIQEYEAAKGIGSVPGMLKQALRLKLHPIPDPFDQLRSAVCTSVASPVGGRDFSRRRQSRRQGPAPSDPILYGRITTQPNAIVIVDTSGSMSDTETRDKCLSVVAQGLRKLHRVRVICADTAVRSNSMVASISRFEWVGGGGTKMDVALMEVDRDLKPDAIIIITDAMTRWPRKPTRARVVVAHIGPASGRWFDSIPSWCRKVPMTRKDS